MHTLKQNQKGPYCTYCKVNRATRRTKHFHEYACNNQDCLNKAITDEQHRDERGSHYTEADYQTWNK